MIIVHSIENFNTFVERAKALEVPYQIIGSEEDGPSLFSFENTKPMRFYFTYALLCPMFTVSYSDSIEIEEKAKITKHSQNYALLKFKTIALKNDTLDCS